MKFFHMLWQICHYSLQFFKADYAGGKFTGFHGTSIVIFVALSVMLVLFLTAQIRYSKESRRRFFKCIYYITFPVSAPLIALSKLVIFSLMPALCYRIGSKFFEERIETYIANEYRHIIKSRASTIKGEIDREEMGLLKKEVDKWKTLYDEERTNKESVYWDGAKYGYSLGEKKGKSVYGMPPGEQYTEPNVAEVAPEDWDRWWRSSEGQAAKRYAIEAINKLKSGDVLTEAQEFILTQILKGNNKNIGFNGAVLEDRGYIKLIWDDEKKNKFHYELTDFGISYLRTKASGQTTSLSELIRQIINLG